jgi:hypothetical protein
MTAGAAWLDEAGQSKFRLGSWQTIQQRVSIHEGRIFITTTPYAMASWLKHKIVDPWQSEKDKGREHPEIDLIRFSSAMNPVYPLQELEKAKRDLPAWKYRMNHEGEFERPAGMVYDCWEELRNACARFPVPPAWPRHAGLDFGGVNTAAVFLAEELDGVGLKTGRFFAYRVYNPKKSKTAAQHVLDILAE